MTGRMSTRLSRFALLLAVLCAAGSTSSAQERLRMWALTQVRLGDAEGAPLKTLLLAEGRIRAVLEPGAQLPPAARVVDANQMVALPGLVDAYALTGAAPLSIEAARDWPTNASADLYVDMRAANRKGIAPAAKVADRLTLDAELRGKWRGIGYTHLVLAPSSELLSGRSALVVLRERAARDLIVREQVFDHAGFDSNGAGYPGTLMGSMAQLRQFFMDARWVQELDRRQLAGKSGPRPPYDPDLRAIGTVLRKEQRLWCEAESSNDIDRWLRLADEFGFEIGIVGGRDAFQRAAVLAARRIPVILTLNWGEEPPKPDAPKVAPEPEQKAAEQQAAEKKAAEEKPQGEGAAAAKPEQDAKPVDRFRYTLPEPVKAERRRRWEEQRACVRTLLDAGVVVAFGSGKEGAGEILAKARTLVSEKVISEAQSLAALSSQPLALAGAAGASGRLEAGKGANLAVWTKHPLQDKDAKVAWLFAEGIAYEFEIEDKASIGRPDEGVEVDGRWELSYEQAEGRTALLSLEMDAEGKLKGSLRLRVPGAGADNEFEVGGRVIGRKLSLEGSFNLGSFPVQISLDGTLEDEEITGTVKWKGSEREDSQKFRATRKPSHDGKHDHPH